MFQGRDLLKLPNDQMRLVRGADIAMIFPGPDDVRSTRC